MGRKGKELSPDIKNIAQLDTANIITSSCGHLLMSFQQIDTANIKTSRSVRTKKLLYYIQYYWNMFHTQNNDNEITRKHRYFQVIIEPAYYRADYKNHNTCGSRATVSVIKSIKTAVGSMPDDVLSLKH
ncbi:hypothetical protein KUTeg_019478 [Tegillarca granosa]|uniref:Uncharacterized protein n=1 Tax=Tegillarca granosa TaxID=220873 RepID=A0ABQ9ECQ5_TEGGR|nr:hypothetical protein KUTeg_019478 [Tegillarca granosa]